jgi:hypothetical protein
MKMNLRTKYVRYFLYFLIGVSLLTAGNVALRRVQFEKANNKIEVAVSMKEIDKLALLGGVERAELLSALKKIGITSLALEEYTVRDYEDDGLLTILKGSEIANKLRVGKTYRYIMTHVSRSLNVARDKDKYYLIVDQQKTYDRIKDFLLAELFGNVKQEIKWNILEVSDELEDFSEIGLGISEQEIKEAEGFGFGVLPRLKNSRRLSEALIELKFLSFAKGKNVSTVIFEGESVLGYPVRAKMRDVQEKMRKQGLNLGYIEFADQKGVKEIAAQIPESVVRVFSISDREMMEISPQKALAKYLRGAKERGIRVLFLHPFFNYYGDENMVEYNLKYFGEILAGIKDLGFENSRIEKLPMASYVGVQTWEVFVLSLGVLAALVLLVSLFLPIISSVLFLVAFFGVYLVAFFVFQIWHWQEAWISLMALTSAVVFPALAIISQFPHQREKKGLNIYLSLVLYLFKVTLITLGGALLITAFLADPIYLFGIKKFFGVKISLLLPIILIGLYFYLTPERMKSAFYVFRRLFLAPVKTGSMIAAVLLVVFVFLYILRSGNYIGFQLPWVEEWMRDLLETLLFVRPRTKEFLIGYPFLMIGFMLMASSISIYVARNWLWFFNGLGAVALISLINSFCHIHTPLLLSLYRSVLGLMLGLIFGFILIFGLKFMRFLFRKWPLGWR